MVAREALRSGLPPPPNACPMKSRTIDASPLRAAARGRGRSCMVQHLQVGSADGMIVVAIVVGSVADILTPRAASGWDGARPLDFRAALLISVPLLWRKTSP